MLLPLQGVLYRPRLPRVPFATLTLPWAMVSLALQAVPFRPNTPKNNLIFNHNFEHLLNRSPHVLAR